jgi:hypothetical protein
MNGTGKEESRTKFTLALNPEQNRVLDNLQGALKASSRSEVIRKALALAELYADAVKNGQKLCLTDSDGKILETLRFF